MSANQMPWWAGVIAPDPEKDEAAGGQRLQGGKESADDADSIDRDTKWRAQMAAEFALAGWALADTKCGGFIVGRWGRTRYCQDPDSLAAFLAEVKGVRS